MTRLCPPDLWETLASADDSATFFQTPAWHALAEDFEGTRSVPLLFEHEGLQAVLPLQGKRRPWGELLASPFGTYATLVCAPNALPEAMAGLIARVARELARLNLDVPGSPFSARLPVIGRPLPSRTRLLRLDALEPASWVAAWSRNHRRLLNAAGEAGLSVRPARDAADVAAYHAVYARQADRWGAAARRVYPAELFQEIFRRLAPSGTARLWLAESGGEVVAGRLCFRHGFHAVEWHAAAERAAMDRGANHLLVHAAVLHAREQGCAVYDFNPNPGLPAVEHFKRGFATETAEFRGFSRRTGWVGALAALKGSFARLRGGTSA